ncbi:MAG: T9SS type A sorting domain-containing protein [Lewinellaceae bacterium]|nr:T9SS type A sorting domain-containing protein [Lewinellaceae bacterium]
MRKPNTFFLALLLGLCSFFAHSQVLQQLPTNFLSQGDLFGQSVAINGYGNYIVVGAPFHRDYEDAQDQQEGVAFVYTYSGGAWILQDTLNNPFLDDMAALGSAVGINTDGTLAAVGASGEKNNRGDARLFKRIGSSWAMLPALVHSGSPGNQTGAGPGDHFGASIALDGSGYYMAAGSPTFQNAYGRANVCYFNSGSNTWNYASLENPDQDKGDYFGVSLAIDVTGNYLVIGAPGDDPANNNQTDNYGAVYYYKRDPMTQNTWNLEQVIKPLSLQSQSQFGFAVDLNRTGDSLIVGAPGHNGTGAAFLFKKLNTGLWMQTDLITPHNPVAGDQFGSSVSLSGDGDIALIGAPLRDTAAMIDLGAAFLFNYVDPGVEWSQFKNLSLPPGYEAGETFGAAVSIANNLFTGVIGSPFRSLNRGAAFVVLPTALPVTWLDFRAEVTGEDVLLTWSTASESSNKGFEIQRSTNGRDWERIGFVPGIGSTSEVQNYDYTDSSPFTLHSSLIYYRLAQRDFNGATDYSPIRVVQIQSAGGIRVFPNPANELVTVAFSEPTDVRSTVQLFDQNGRMVGEYSVPPGTVEYQVRVAQLASGTYLLKVKVGTKEWMNRLVVE